MNEFDLKNYLSNNPLMEKEDKMSDSEKEKIDREADAVRDDLDQISKLAKDAGEDAKDIKDMVDESETSELTKEEMSNPVMRRGLKGDDKEEKRTEKMREGEEPKLTKEGLKDMIREKITSILNEEEELMEQEDVDVEDDVDVDVRDKEEVDVDVEKDVEVDDVSKETDIDVKTSLPGESEDVDAVLGLLTKASEEAGRFADDEELKTQIGNVITYFTRKHVAK